MYTNIRQKKNNSRFFYMVIVLVAACMLIAFIVSSPTFFVRTTTPHDAHSDTAATLPPQTSDTESAATTEAPVSETEDSVTTADSAPAVTTADTAAADTTDAPDTPSVDAKPADTDVVLALTEDAGQSYQDRIVFLGDSTTYSFLYYEKLAGGKETNQVWTPASRTLTLDQAPRTTILYPDTDEEITIGDALQKKQPEILVITLGVNGISYMKEDYFTVSYKKLIDLVKENSPSTVIILQSIFPVAKSWEKTQSINNDKITAANGWIRQIAMDCGVSYLDTISILAIDEGGYLPESYQNGDGLHLNSDACSLVLDYIRTHAHPDFLS